MPISTTLRLVGCLHVVNPSSRQIAEGIEELESKLGLTTNGGLTEQLATRLNRILEHRGLGELVVSAKNGAKPSLPIVAGIAVRRDGKSGQGLLVEVLRATLSPTRGGMLGGVLATGKTNRYGEFALTLPEGTAQAIRVRIRDGAETLHMFPPQLVNGELWVEWCEAGVAIPRPGRFELRETLLQAELAPSGRRLPELDDTAELPELGLLAELSGVSVGLARTHALAARVAEAIGIPAAVAFVTLPPPTAVEEPFTVGELARRAEASRRGILRRAPSSIVADLERAIEAGDVSAELRPQLGELEARLDAARLAFLRSEPADGGSPWQDLLAAVGIEATELDACLRILADRVGEDRWVELGHAVGTKRAPTIREALELAPLVGNDARVLADLRKRGSCSLLALSQLAAPDLDAALVDACPDADRRATLVARLTDEADSRLSGITVLRRRQARLRPETLAFVAKLGKGFDVRTAHVEKLLRDSELGLDGDASRAVQRELLRIQRIVRVAQHGARADALLDKGYGSAQQIAFTPLSTFLASTKDAISSEEAEAIYERARAHYRATLSVYMNYNPAAGGLVPAALAHNAELWAAAAAADLPTYQFLFGAPTT